MHREASKKANQWRYSMFNDAKLLPLNNSSRNTFVSNHSFNIKSVDHAILTNCLKHCWVSSIQLISDPNQTASVATCESSFPSANITFGISQGIVLGPDNISNDTMLSLRAHLSDKDTAMLAFPPGKVILQVFSMKKNDKKQINDEEKRHECSTSQI